MNRARRISRVLGLFAACFAFVGGAFIASAPSARANLVTWNLENFLFEGGGTATGSFDYDADTNTFSAINVTTDAERTYEIPTGQGNARVFDTFIDITNTGTPDLGDSRFVFSLVSQITNEAIRIDLAISDALTSVGLPTSVEVLFCGPNDLNTIGPDVPCTTSSFVRRLLAGSITATQSQVNSSSIASEMASIPEPSTLALFAFGLAGLGFMGWRRRTA